MKTEFKAGDRIEILTGENTGRVGTIQNEFPIQGTMYCILRLDDSRDRHLVRSDNLALLTNPIEPKPGSTDWEAYKRGIVKGVEIGLSISGVDRES